MREPCKHCGERHFASDDNCPKPTGEWTAERVLSILGGNLITGEVKRLAYEINAAVAAERENAEKAAARAEATQIQLAAQREMTETYRQLWQDESKSHRHDIDYQDNEIQQLREQLAAEREKVDLWKRQAAFESEHREKYRSRVQTLVDAIQAHKELACCDSYEMFDAALAKVKEGTFQNQPKEPSEKQQQ